MCLGMMANFLTFAILLPLAENIMRRLLTVSIFILLAVCANAQPPDPPGGGGIPCGPPFGEACIPIDGGVSLLVAAGLALGGKRAYDLSRGKKG